MKKNRRIIKSLIIIIIMLILIFIFFYFLIPDLKIKEETVNLPLGSTYSYNEYTAKILGMNVKSEVSIDTSKVDYNTPGTYEVTYTIKEGFLSVTKTQTINVVDETEPVIELTGSKELTLCSVDDYIEEGYSAIDNTDGNLTDYVNITRTDHFIYYEVEDKSGNKTSTGRIVKISDEEAPVITLNGNSNDTVRLNETYNDPGVTVTDNCIKDLRDKVVVEGTVDTTKTGNYKLTYTVSDNLGNTSQVTRDVYVYDPSQNSGIIYLTFDDGPGVYTDEILDILNKYNIKATFFVTMKGNDSTILREYNEGHTVALHTASHEWSIYDSEEAYFNDLYKVYNRVKDITGYDPKYIRFPGGSSNTVSKSHCKGIMTTLTKAVEEKGFKYYDWNVSVEDAGTCAYKSSDTRSSCVIEYFKSGLKKNKANIVLMHDIKGYTKDALEEMINYATSEGYTFKQIDDNAPEIHQHVNN